jgi:hypothetical protein
MNFKTFIEEGIQDKGIFKACFMAGSPGSGKSYVINKITSGQIAPRIVNTDTWKNFVGIKYADWKNFEHKLKILTTKQLSLYVNSLLPLWIDSTSTNEYTLIKRKGLLEQKFGYDTAIIFVNTPLDLAIKRNAQRPDPVPEKYLVDAWNSSQLIKKDVAKVFDVVFEIDNGEGELTDKSIKDAYIKTNNFFLSPLKNELGQKFNKTLNQTGQKYLSDLTEYSLDQIVSEIKQYWFSKASM